MFTNEDCAFPKLKWIFVELRRIVSIHDELMYK